MPGTAILASLIAGAVTDLRHRPAPAPRRLREAERPLFACFAVGVLIALSFLHRIRESLALGPRAPLPLLAGCRVTFPANSQITMPACAAAAP